MFHSISTYPCTNKCVILYLDVAQLPCSVTDKDNLEDLMGFTHFNKQ